jgi:peptide-methionine (R)-S-oxide reductase
MENIKILKTNEEWKKILTPIQYRILREGGTDIAFTGKLWDNKEKGTYSCVACGNKLYSSKTKFDSGTGWPSFYAPLSEDSIFIKPLPTGIHGSEVICARCEGHHGHVFLDGPRPTGLRFCMNDSILKFEK